jgi:ATP-dependent Lhr-like helicase
LAIIRRRGQGDDREHFIAARLDGQPWTAFTPIQVSALRKIPIDPKVALPDVVLAADTATGKTEAAFLPLLARSLKDRPANAQGFEFLYISPLKALINEMADTRLPGLAKAAKLLVHPWHSDVLDSSNTQTRKSQTGILLTTPESIEAFFLRRFHDDRDLVALLRVKAIIIDEVHAFFESARGRHLQSLLHRIDTAAERPIPRIALSATLGKKPPTLVSS